MNDHQKWLFREYREDTKQAILSLVQNALQSPIDHVIQCGKSGDPKRPYSYQVVLPSGEYSGSAIKSNNDLLQRLGDEMGIVDWINHSWDSFRFKPEMFRFYREMFPMSDLEKYRAVIQHFHRRLRNGEGPTTFDPSDIAKSGGLLVEDVLPTVRSLESAEFIVSVGPKGPDMPRMYDITMRGTQWAMAGYPENMLFSPSINVHVQFDIQPLVDIIMASELSKADRKDYERRAMRFEREVKQGRLSWQTFRENIEMMANVNSLAPTMINLIANNKDQILNALQIV